MTQVFAYLTHTDGVLDDAAMELATAAKAVSSSPATAIVAGSGVDAIAASAAAIFDNVIKVDNAALAYPNAEVVRKALVNIIPKGSVVLFAHSTFSMDCAPGLSIKLGASFAASGLADLALYEGRFAEAIRMLEQGAAADVAADVGCKSVSLEDLAGQRGGGGLAVGPGDGHQRRRDEAAGQLDFADNLPPGLAGCQ